MNAIILAGGSGRRLWPYGEIRNKVMTPVAGRPLVHWAAEAAITAGAEKIIVCAGPHSEQITNYFHHNERVQVISSGDSRGAPFTLRSAQDQWSDPMIVLNGDTLYELRDIRTLMERSAQGSAVLLASLADGEYPDCICAHEQDGMLARIEGHPLEPMAYRISAYGLTRDFWPYIHHCSDVMTYIPVGMMPPMEGFLEMCAADCIRDGHPIGAVKAQGPCLDVDKPWDLLRANNAMVKKLCGDVGESSLGPGASIDPSAVVEGHVILGRNCHIGRNVLIKGNVIAGDNTRITEGAMILGDAIIGSDCSVRQYCLIDDGSALGNRCVVGHCAEFSGMAMDCVYLCHYMEFTGILGQNTDLGAATVCGTLRFDNGNTVHKVRGRREIPREYANAVYLGDFCRTGINAILMPGVKTGPYSIVGPGVILSEDLPSGKLIMNEHKTVLLDWSPDRYGW